MKMQHTLSRVFRAFGQNRAVALAVLMALGVSCGLASTKVRSNAMLLIQAVRSRAGSVAGAQRTPQLTAVTEGTFEYEGFMHTFSGSMPSSPNTWHLVSTITNGDTKAVEIVPLYLYSESSPSDKNGFENSATICPKSYVHDFSEDAQKGLTLAPEGWITILRCGDHGRYEAGRMVKSEGWIPLHRHHDMGVSQCMGGPEQGSI